MKVTWIEEHGPDGYIQSPRIDDIDEVWNCPDCIRVSYEVQQWGQRKGMFEKCEEIN